MGLSKRQAQYRIKLPTIRGSVRKLRRGDVSMGDHTGKVVQILAYLGSKLSINKQTARGQPNGRTAFLQNLFATQAPVKTIETDTILSALTYASGTRRTNSHQSGSRGKYSEGYLAPYVWRDDGGAYYSNEMCELHGEFSALQ